MPAALIIKKDQLVENYNHMCNRLDKCDLHYALKANSEIEILEILNGLSAKFEVASEEEFKKLLKIKVKPQNIICGLPVKGVNLIKRLYNSGCRYFVFDDIGELDKIETYAEDSKKILRIYISDLDKDSFKYGMELKEIFEYKEKIPEFFDKFDGITFHISRNYRLDILNMVFERVECILKEFNQNQIKLLNIGGGYRISLPLHLSMKYDLERFYEVLDQWLIKFKNKYNIIIYCEPGRGIIESAASIVTKVDLVKNKGNSYDVYMDLNIGKIPGAHPDTIYIVHGGLEKECVYDLKWHMENASKEEKFMHNFIDLTCEYHHFYSFPLKRIIKQGEIVEFKGMGAYSTCLSSNFHARTKPTVKVI